MDITLRQLRALDAVARAGSFTAAAARLHLTQSAVSVLIGELEGAYGLRLFDRTTRMVQLTEAGREFLPVAQQMLADLDHALKRSRDLRDKASGRVTIAATPLMSAILLPGAIARYAQRHPGVQVRLLDTLAAQVSAKVRDGEADFGIGTALRSNRELDVLPLMVDRLVLACPRGHALAERVRGVAWRELAGLPFIALARDNSVGQLIGEQLAAAGVDVRVVHEASYLWTALGLVEAGLGVTVLPSYARPAVRRTAIVIRPLVRPVVRRETSILVRRGRSLSPAAQSLREFLQQNLVERVRDAARA
ncbi:MAG: LysR substrate-binding domain-containing protein [Burkholderiaceae bacterium]